MKNTQIKRPRTRKQVNLFNLVMETPEHLSTSVCKRLRFYAFFDNFEKTPQFSWRTGQNNCIKQK